MARFARPRGYSFNWGSFITPGVKTIVLVCTGIFLTQVLILLFLPQAVTQWVIKVLGLTPWTLTRLFVWQPVTYIFLHDPTSLLHILINMLMLWMFGRDLEQIWGKQRFYRYFLMCGAGAGLINVVVKLLPILWGGTLSITPTIGASGAIFGILIANAILFPDRQIWLIPFPVTIAMRPYVAVMAAIEFFATLGSGGDNVAHICHLGGMLVGYLYLRRGSMLYRARNRYTDWKIGRTRRKFEVYMREHKDEPPSRPDRWVN